MPANIKIVMGSVNAKLRYSKKIKNLKKELILEGLGCANCASKIEKQVSELKGINSASLNFITKILSFEINEIDRAEEIIKDVKKIINDIESKVHIIEKEDKKTIKREFLLEGLDCANCAAKIERECSNVKGIKCATADFIATKLIIEIEDVLRENDILQEINKIIKRIEPDVNVILISDKKKKAENSEKESNKSEYLRLIIGALIFGIAIIADFNSTIEFIMYFTSYIIIGGEVFLSAFRNILKGQIFDENFLMGIATIGAFAIGQYPEGVAVMLFYQIGEMFQNIAVNRSRKSISALMDIRPDFANLKVNDQIKKVDPEQVKINDVIVVKPGEKVPLDGVVIEGKSMVDTSALTGESVPRKVETGDNILSGVINKNGLLTIKVEKEFGESTVSKILELVQNASSKKAPTENFITKFARYYTPAVVFVALALAVIPPLILKNGSFSQWIYRALSFLVVSCPCALVISIPLGFFGGIGGASKSGVLIKGGNYLEALNNVEMVVFDKTGTLTKGIFEVTEINSENGFSKDELLTFAAFAESYSNHPIAVSILKAYNKSIDKKKISNYEEISGQGIKINLDGKEILAGNYKLMNSVGVKYKDMQSAGTLVYVAVDKIYAGCIIISDEVKEDSAEAIKMLKAAGVKKTVMLTGDNKAVAEKIAEELKLDEYYSELLPDKKVEKLELLFKQKSPKGKIVFAGDGVNDAPVLARADIGIAMGGVGSDAAIEAADVVIMTDELSKIAAAIKIAKKTRSIVMQNIIFALGVKLIVLILVAIGLGTMWEAVFADVGVTLIAVLNAMRAMKVENI